MTFHAITIEQFHLTRGLTNSVQACQLRVTARWADFPPQFVIQIILSVSIKLYSSQSLVFDDIKMSHPPDRIPVLLLKTRSTPVDTYDEYFSNEPFAPTFIPVLEHRPNTENLEFVRSLLLDGKLGREHNAKYGGIIFTSQRAVEGFAKAVDQAEADSSRLGSPLEFTYSLFPIHRSILHRVNCATG